MSLSPEMSINLAKHFASTGDFASLQRQVISINTVNKASQAMHNVKYAEFAPAEQRSIGAMLMESTAFSNAQDLSRIWDETFKYWTNEDNRLLEVRTNGISLKTVHGHDSESEKNILTCKVQPLAESPITQLTFPLSHPEKMLILLDRSKYVDQLSPIGATLNTVEKSKLEDLLAKVEKVSQFANGNIILELSKTVNTLGAALLH